MQLRKTHIKRSIIAITAVAITYYGFTSRINYMQSGPYSIHHAQDSIYTTGTVFKTILSADNVTDLLGFELHTKYTKHAGTIHTEYNVVMRSLDPSIDTYKTYCHDIITDLMAGNDAEGQITINVFDSFEAYCFYADENPMKHDDGMLLAQHLVATYEQEPYAEDPYCALTYYPYAANYLRETTSCN